MLADHIEQLRHQLVQMLAECDPIADDELAAAVGALQRLLNTSEELRRRFVSRAASSELWADEGFRSVGSWLAGHTGLSPTAAVRVAHQAQASGHLGETSRRALDGRLNGDHVRHIARCAAVAPDRFDANWDDTFSSLASSGDQAAFTQATRAWLAAVKTEDGPDTPPPEARARFSMSQTFDGWWHGEFLLTPEDGALLHQAIERRVGRYLRARRDGDPSVAPLPTAAMRAQALIDVADNALRNDGSKRSAPDRYSIALTLHASHDGTLTPDGALPAGATCDASTFRLVIGADGEVLDIGRSVRTAPPYLATAVARRDGRCTFPGCDAPPSHCDCHHCEEWEHGGATSINNLVLLCRWHHTFVHRKKWRVHLDEHQRPLFIKPCGGIHHRTATAPLARTG